jgi:hypothetical protein
MRDAAALILLQMNKATKMASLADGPISLEKLVSSGATNNAINEMDNRPVGIFAIGGIDEETN